MSQKDDGKDEKDLSYFRTAFLACVILPKMPARTPSIALTHFYCHSFNFQVVRDFKRPNGTTEKEIDANGDGRDFERSCDIFCDVYLYLKFFFVLHSR